MDAWTSDTEFDVVSLIANAKGQGPGAHKEAEFEAIYQRVAKSLPCVLHWPCSVQ